MNAPAASSAIFLVGNTDVPGIDTVLEVDVVELEKRALEDVVDVCSVLLVTGKLLKLAVRFAGKVSLS